MKQLIWFVLFCCISCTENKQSDDRQVFIYNQPNSITTLDPAFAKSQNIIWAVDHMYNGLVQLDSNLVLQPCLAKSWSISPDGKIYTFYLRDGVTFHPNTLFDASNRFVHAADVVASFNRLIDTTIYSPGSWLFNGKVRDEAPFVAVNDTTFEMHLKEPFIPMLNILTMQYCSVMPSELAEQSPQYVARNPIGTGPFKLIRWELDRGLYLGKHDQYFESTATGPLPKCDAIKVEFIADRKVAFLELLNRNKLDAVSGLESSFINELLEVNGQLKEKHKDKLHFYKSPYLNFEYIGINTDMLMENHPLRHVQVRQALNYAIDRKSMLASIRNSVGIPALQGVIPAGLTSYDATFERYAYNPLKAANLLAEAGYKGGQNMPELTLYTNHDYLDICTYVAQYWGKIGVRAKIELLESATLREKMRNGQISLFRASWIADYPDAESFLCMFYGENPAPPNYTRYKNEQVDVWYTQSVQEVDPQERIKLYQSINQRILDDAPVIFLFYDETALFAKSHIQGLETNGMNLLKVKGIYEK